MKRIFVNNYIRAREVRLIDETSKQLGIMPLEEALSISKERGLDLIQVTEKVEPPVCRIGDYGKYLYQQEKKERKIKQRGGEVKEVRLTFAISDHDLEIRVAQSEKFLKEGNVVKVSLPLRGREKALGNFAREKMQKFIDALSKLASIKLERELKREPRGFTMIISKQ